jgi:hypothetical protein
MRGTKGQGKADLLIPNTRFSCTQLECLARISLASMQGQDVPTVFLGDAMVGYVIALLLASSIVAISFIETEFQQ